MIENAIQELKQHNYVINNEIFKFKKANTTYIEEDTLYYRSITEGLLALNVGQNLAKNVSRLGIMYDISRCAALTIASFKSELRTLAVLGYDYIMIYAEDMFELDIPSFGYMRGRYSANDIIEIVEYAAIFGIDVIPCIQSLGHYENFLKWDNEKKYADTSSVLNVNSEHVDSLLNSLLKFCQTNFKSKSIHIGMDEANDLGRGYYLRDMAYTSQADIFISHLKKMYNKCIDIGYNEVIIWSDMLFTFDNLQGELYDNNINSNVLSELNSMEKLKLCYWNYWSKTSDQHAQLIRAHSYLFPHDKIICAGGINQWGQLNYLIDSNKSFNALQTAMQQEGCNDLLLTIWGDGAAYTNFYTSKFGIFERALDTYQLKNDTDFFYNIFGFTQDDVRAVSDFSLKVPNAPLYLWENPLELAFSKCNRIDRDLFEKSIITTNVADQLEYTKQLVNFTIYKALLADDMLSGNFQSKYLELTLSTYLSVYSLFREYWFSLYKIQGLGVAQGRFSLLQNRLLEIEYRNDNNIEFPEILEHTEVIVKDLFKDLFYSTNLRS